jgi:hypothetical protein
LGISPAIVANPLATMPPAALHDLIDKMSLKATKAQDLALAATGAGSSREAQMLTAASIKKLDNDLRTVHANTVFAAQDARDSDGWMRWARKEHDIEISQLRTEVQALLEILTPMLNDAQKARVCSAPSLCQRPPRTRKETDRVYMDSWLRRSGNASA